MTISTSYKYPSLVYLKAWETKGNGENPDEWDGSCRAQTQDRVPGLIKKFLEDFQTMDPRLRKSHLQTILKAAHISRDTIELEFRV